MPLRKPNRWYWAAIAVLTVIFVAAKYGGPVVTNALYWRGSAGVLNVLTGAPSASVRDLPAFYAGRMTDVLWGPMAVASSGLAFLLIVLMFLRESGPGAFTAGVFCYLLLTKIEVLTFPPYGDAVGGPFAEALWLLGHKFHYAALLAQPSYNQGGPKVYMLSVFPTFLAVMMRLITNVKAFLAVNHLIVFLEGAVTVAAFRQILRKTFSETDAALVAVLLLAFPLFQSQVEAINMEMPMTVFAVLAALALTEKRMRAAALFAILATMIKGVAVLMCAVVLAVGVVIAWTDSGRRRRIGAVMWGLAALVFAALKTWGVEMAFRGDGRTSLMGWMKGWPSIRLMPAAWIYICAIVVLIVVALRRLRRKTGGFLPFLPALVMFLCTAAWFAFFFNASAVSPRYQLLLAPFTLYSTYWAANALMGRWPRVLRGVTVAAIAFYFFAAYGLMTAPALTNNHVILEQSLEYRNDQKVDIQLAKVLQERYRNDIIGAPFILAQELAIPRLGYVRVPLHVIIYGMTLHYGGIHNFHGLNEALVRRTIWIGVDADKLTVVPYPIGPGDVIQEEVRSGDKHATLFRGGFAIDRVWRALQWQMYRERMGE